MKKTKAKESAHVRRTRKKLERRLAEIDEKVTPKALQEVSLNIHKWIARHEGERIPLKDKPITLFDENLHPEKVKSHFVNEMLNDLKKQVDEERTYRTLKGRIKTD